MFKRSSAEPEPLAAAPSGAVPEVVADEQVPESPGGGREFGFDSSLRERAARGTLINSGFYVGLSALGLIRGFVLAAIVSRSDYGLWGILVVALGTILSLTQVGINDKFIEQDEPDQEIAFQKAFTLDLVISLASVVLVGALMPVVLLAYDTPELLAPGLVILLAFVAAPFQAPLWVFYRRMDYVRQRLLQAADPIVAFVLTIGLALLGAGYWSFVIGFTGGVVAASILAVIFSPYRLKLRFEWHTAKRYLSFSWPIFVASACALITAQSAILTSRLDLGVAATGVLILASQITIFTDRVDQVVTGTLYPAICAAKEKTEVLYESFVKSNRLALMWAVPFGLGLTLFSSDLVSFVIGERWRAAVPVLQIFGVVAAVNHVGFNWTAYFQARANTKPIAMAMFASTVAFVAVGVPLILSVGVSGFAIGVAAQTVVGLAFRTHYLRQLFISFRFFGHAIRAFLPTLPAVAIVLLVRVAEPGSRAFGVAAMEFVIYLGVTAMATWYFESNLLSEVRGYTRGRGPGASSAVET